MSNPGPLAHPKVSVLFPFGGDVRRAEDALYALSTRAQRNVAEEDYEVLAAEWESPDLLGGERATAVGGAVRYFRCERPPDTLGSARLALTHARAPFIGLVSGTSPLLTPRTVELALLAAKIDPDPLAVVPSYRLFDSRQDGQPSVDTDDHETVLRGQDGYRLFEFARFASSFERGFLSPFADVNCLFVRRESLQAALEDGSAPDVPLISRLVARRSARLVVLAGEGAFSPATEPVADEEPPATSRPVPTREPLILGAFPGEVQRLVVEATDWAVLFHAVVRDGGGRAYPLDP